jgi:xylitol oxidase
LSNGNHQNRFVDLQLKGPYTLWRHEHRFFGEGNGTRITDEVRYILPFGFVGRLAYKIKVKEDVEAIFAYRRRTARRLCRSFIEYKCLRAINAGIAKSYWLIKFKIQLRDPSMNKRTFIKLIAAILASPIVMRMLACAEQEKLRNWAGHLEYSSDRVQTATSLVQVQDYVKTESKLKVLGTRHCFNNIADSKDGFLSLKPMDKVIAIDPAKRTVTVGAGITYGQLCPYLDGKGFALHNLASLPHISVAGACSTATHGSGQKNGNLSTAVSGLEMVKADGSVVNLSREKDGDQFLGAVVGLGALGVITKVTLDIQPSYRMRQYVYENLPIAELKDHFDAIEASGYSVSLFTDWQKQRINEVWIKSRVEDGQAFHPTPEFFGAKLATRNLHPIAELSAENCTEQMGVPGPWYERLPHFRMGFTPSAGKELQSEYFVPRQHAVEAILAVERLRDQVSPSLLISEIRAIAADNLWMSPCYKQDSVTIHFTWKPDWPTVSKLLPVIEKALAPFNACPHWGKLFTTSPTELKRLHAKMPEFIELSTKFDPQGKFRNQFLNLNIFG